MDSIQKNLFIRVHLSVVALAKADSRPPVRRSLGEVGFAVDKIPNLIALAPLKTSPQKVLSAMNK